MSPSPLLAPILALVGWTLVMLVVAIVQVQRGVRAAQIGKGLPRSTRARDVETMMDLRFSYGRQNYEHLVEQPTLFYALVLVLALIGDASMTALVLAWTYVAFRVVHSIAQALGRNRTLGFAVSSLALLALYAYAVIAYLA